MRALCAFAFLLLAGCTGAPPITPPDVAPEEGAPIKEVTLVDQQFVARSGETGEVQLDVPASAKLVLRVTLDTGAGKDLVFHGLGACDGFTPVDISAVVKSGAEQERECGSVAAGPQSLSWTADGAFQGTVQVRATVS